MNPIFKGKVEAGKLILESPDNFREHIKGLKGDVEVTVKRKTKRISNPQLRYYFSVIVKILSKELGYTPDEIDTILKYKFCRRFDDKGLLILPSKTEFSTVYAETFFEEVRTWALIDLGITIPEPNTVEF